MTKLEELKAALDAANTGALSSLLSMGYLAQNEGMIWITTKEGRAT